MPTPAEILEMAAAAGKPWKEAAESIGRGVGSLGDDDDGDWEEVTSSHLDAIRWAGGEMYGTIHVRFKNGSVYDYPAESRETYDGLLNAGSHGAFYWRNIRIS